MAEISKNNYLFLNREGRWPGFRWSGLELRKDGALQLFSLPSLSGALPEAVNPVPSGPAGLALDNAGTLYFSDPDANRVQRILGCDKSVCATPCMGGSGSGPSGLKSPRGLLIPPARSSLFVVDSGNHRIQIFDLATFQLVAIWGQAGMFAQPAPGTQPGQFDTPWTLAGDSAANIYVVDYGNKRVQKFNAVGDVIPSFWENASASGALKEPSDIAVREVGGVIWIFVVDTSSPAVFVFHPDGHPVLGVTGQPIVLKHDQLKQPMGIAADCDSVYLGDNASQRILRFDIAAEFEFAGTAGGYQGPVAALLLDRQGGLWVHSGGGLLPNRLEEKKAYNSLGTLYLDPTSPIQLDDRPVFWHRLQALVGTLPANVHLDLYAYAGNDLSKPPAVDTSAPNPFADPKWQSIHYTANLDVTDLYIGGAPARYLWLGALFSGDGSATPVLRQLRVEFDYPAYQQYLPAIYRNTADCGEFLTRLLSLCASFFSGVEWEIDSLPRLFDPQATPERFLGWLAGCLGLDLDSNWNAQVQREIIAEIFRLSGKRGTAAGLRQALRLFAGVHATIEEPLLNASWWCLPDSSSCCESCASQAAVSGNEPADAQNSVLGWTTMLAPAQPQGAVVGTSAVLDQSHLITDQEFGAPLFSDVAYQFTVGVFRSQVMRPETLARIEAIVEQEKPAHTRYRLCVIDPHFRVGFQSRLGIDTVVGGPPRSLALGAGQPLGKDSALAGPALSLLGTDSTLGVTTRLA